MCLHNRHPHCIELLFALQFRQRRRLVHARSHARGDRVVRAFERRLVPARHRAVTADAVDVIDEGDARVIASTATALRIVVDGVVVAGRRRHRSARV